MKIRFKMNHLQFNNHHRCITPKRKNTGVCVNVHHANKYSQSPYNQEKALNTPAPPAGILVKPMVQGEEFAFASRFRISMCGF